MEQSPIDMPIIALKQRCSQEISKYYQLKEGDDRYCLEIFRRAMIDGDNEAWIALQEQFRSNVLSWLHVHSKRQEALQIDTAENYVDDTFKRLWQWGKNQQHEFQSLAGALKSLHLCLNSLIIDTLRTNTRHDLLSLLDDRDVVAADAEDHYDKHELWRAIETLITDKQELRVMFLLYNDGLKPREIVERCPEEFADIKEVYRLARNGLERLKRNAEILRWKISYDE
jgi:DNA-directed RNA polymerase specialized sigma24 family protein